METQHVLPRLQVPFTYLALELNLRTKTTNNRHTGTCHSFGETRMKRGT